MRKLFSPILSRLLFFLLLISSLNHQLISQLPSGFINAKIQDGYTSPMGVIFSKNGKLMFIWEKKGTLWVSVWNGITYVKQGTPVLDIRDEVSDYSDLGFHSVALDPNFDSNGLIYMFYQVDRHHLLYAGTSQYSSSTNDYNKASISRVTRYKVNNSGGTYSADNTSRKVLIGESISTGIPLLFQSHAGGQLLFGTDGTLLVSTGDNASFIDADIGNASETYQKQAIADGIMRPQEDVGAFRAQMLNSFCGKILRIDPNTGNGVSSNPFYDASNPRSAPSRIWTLGLRNPYRFALKTGTGSTDPSVGNPGTLLVGDVQFYTREEVNIIEKGGLNCGWPIYEGVDNAPLYYNLSSTVKNPDESGQPTFLSLCAQSTSLAVNSNVKQRRFTHFPAAFDYAHDKDLTRYPDLTTGSLVAKTVGAPGSLLSGTNFNGNCVTAGTYYTGTKFPSNYQNVFFFADYGTNWIKAVSIHDNSSDHQIHDIKDFAPANFGNGIVDLEYCPLDQSVFFVNINSGEIFKISYGATNRPPVAAVNANKTSGTSPLTVSFSSSGSNDPDGNTITYLWDFGDGTTSTSANPSHTFTSTGSKGFTVTLTVKDDGGLTDVKTIQISTNNTPPSVKITGPTNNALYTLAQASQITAQSTVTDNDATNMQYAWQLTLRHNNHEHREPVTNAKNPVFQIAPVGCDGETYYYLIELKVTDNGGLTGKDSVKIYPDCNSVNLSITNLTASPKDASANLTWVNPKISFDAVMVVAKAGSGFTTNPSGTSYTANSNFTGNGSSFEGGKVVYIGNSVSTTVTGLTNGTRYYFRVFTRKGTTWTGGIETSAVPTATTVSTATTISPQLGCLKASYFNNVSLTGTPSVVRPESSINYDWGTGSPASGINVDNFSARWEGTIIPPLSGNYTFTIIADDGVRLWVNNSLVLDKWFDQVPTTYNISVNLNQNQNIPIKMEYYERGGGAAAKLSWTIPNQTSRIVAFNACSLTTASTQSIFDATKCYQLLARHSGKALEIETHSYNNSINIRQSSWIGSRRQTWRLKAVDATYFKVVNAYSGKVMDVSGSSLSDGANIAQYDYSGSSNQLWKFTKNTEGYYVITAKHSGKVVDVYAEQTQDGANVIQWRSNGGYNQQWKINEIGCPAGSVSLEAAQIYAVDGYREGSKAVLTWISNATDADFFTIEKLNKQGEFETIATINSKELADIYSKNSYNYIDSQPFTGENVYVVKLVTQGGSPQLSRQIKLDFSKKIDFTLFPNPAYDYVDVDMEPFTGRPILLTIINANGQPVKTLAIERAESTNRIEINDLQSGQYILQIHTPGMRDVTRILNITK